MGRAADQIGSQIKSLEPQEPVRCVKTVISTEQIKSEQCPAHMALLRYHKVLVGTDMWTWSSVASCGTPRTR